MKFWNNDGGRCSGYKALGKEDQGKSRQTLTFIWTRTTYPVIIKQKKIRVSSIKYPSAKMVEGDNYHLFWNILH